jgi:hypothetical protein
MSKLCDQVVEALRGAFPQIRIKREEYVSFRNQRLFLDIFVPQLALVIEVHGRQHDNFVEHFHGSIENFRSSRRRDSLKEEWAAESGYTWVVLREHQLPITSEQLLEIIDEVGNG